MSVMRWRQGRLGSVPRALGIVVLAGTLGGPAACGGRLPAPGAPALAGKRRLAPPRRDALDPLGIIVEHRAEVGLDEAQVTAVRGLRMSARRASRPLFEQLDSLDYVLGGRLGAWLREAEGAARPRRRWMPELTLPQRQLFDRLVTGIQTVNDAARCRVDALLSEQQRTAVAALEAATNASAGRRQSREEMPRSACSQPAPQGASRERRREEGAARPRTLSERPGDGTSRDEQHSRTEPRRTKGLRHLPAHDTGRLPVWADRPDVRFLSSRRRATHSGAGPDGHLLPPLRARTVSSRRP